MGLASDRKGAEIAKAKSSLGICTTCNNIETCSSRPGYRSPVFYCELFDNSSESMTVTQVISIAEPEEPINIAMGLCCNCDNRNFCTSSLKPGGIWHCEEYA